MLSKSDKSYAGFTIGPIYEVLSHAIKTRELWFGSYLFSWFMEEIVKRLSANNNIRMLTPYVTEGTSPAGKYHDRFVLCSSLDREALYKEIQSASDDTLCRFANMIDDMARSEQKISGAPSIESILKAYIQRNFVVLDSSLVNNHKVVKTVDEYLNAMEQNRRFFIGRSGNTCFRCKTLPGVIEKVITEKENNVDKPRKKAFCPLCFAKLMCHKSDEVCRKIGKKSGFRYPSIPNISAIDLLSVPEISEMKEAVIGENASLLDIPTNEYDDDFSVIEEAVSRLNKGKPEAERHSIKPFHKYFAVFQADGDCMGRLAGKIGDPMNLSKRLFDFAGEAEMLIRKYRGEPVYIGGDDVLAFLPVAFRSNEGKTDTVIDLALELSEKYREIINKGIPQGDRSTVSIGINIAYHKYPLSRALEDARFQLFARAKDKRNTLAVSLIKHSGFQNTFSFGFDTQEVWLFSELLKNVLSGSVDIPHSLHHNLSRSLKVIAHINDENVLNAFFENNFNEVVHSRYCEGFELVRKMLWDRIAPPKPQIERMRDIEDVLNKLRFIKFMRGDKL